MANLVTDTAMVATGDEATRWAAYSGHYRAPAWGALAPTGQTARFFVDAGVPYFEVDETEALVRHRLVEVAPGLFLADNGETLDLRGPVPRWQGLRLVRVAGGPTLWQWGILGIAAILAAAWLVAAAAREVCRHVVRSASDQQPSASRRWRRIAALTALVTAMLTMGNAALVAWMPGLVDSGFIGWLDLPIAQRFAMHWPLALAVLATCTLVLVAAGKGQRLSSEQRGHLLDF
jgi:hypothetical protein